MKIFKKVKKGNKRKIYFLGIKIFSYKRKSDSISNANLLRVLYDTYNEANYAHKLLLNNQYKNTENYTQNNQEAIKKEALFLKYFDEDYYIKTYPNIKYYNISPLEHYIKYGWKLGLNPSKIFDGNWYLKKYPNVKKCPLLHYLLFGRYNCYYAFYQNPWVCSEKTISNYLKNKQQRQSKKVVYTCLIGNYDELMNHYYINPEWDYVCFTDNENLLKNKYFGAWEIRQIDANINLDNTKKNRYYKINPHIVLPEYDESIYLDANINVISPFIFDLISHKNTSLLIPNHFGQKDLYFHFNWLWNSFPEDKQILDDLYAMIKEDGFPENYGFTENNLLYRKHNSDKIIKVMNDWWYLVKHYSKRDQASLCYVLWKNNILVEDIIIDNLRSDSFNFVFVTHSKDN